MFGQSFSFSFFFERRSCIFEKVREELSFVRGKGDIREIGGAEGEKRAETGSAERRKSGFPLCN